MFCKHTKERCLGPAGLATLILALAVSAPAELVLTNFSAAKPLKIMPIGDSITDDCSINGSYRLYLQPLLQSNNYPFTFVGRQASSPTPSFTKVNHEGYCGSVIAPPGVFAVHGYSTTDAYLLRIVADALAITNNRPDLVLLLIGANDIGRGRDPWFVATNDMPALLDLIQSNAPGVHVILAKITSLLNANLPGLSYGAYATNVPIYNAALQAMVSQRRAAGQNVSLADMYSAVDYTTGFLSDHVHPNGVGLRAMANEWFARIQAITRRTNQFSSTIIHGGATWKCFDTGNDPGTNWAGLDYDDTPWHAGPARLGYGDPATVTTVGFGPNPSNKYLTTYFRHKFVLPWNLAPTNLNLRLLRPSGAAVWLNGREIYRVGLPNGTLTYTNPGTIMLSGYGADEFFPVSLSPDGLRVGTNVLAVEMHQSSPSNAMLGFDLELLASGYRMPEPSLGLSNIPGGVELSWPSSNGQTFRLYSTTNLSAPRDWTESTELTYTNAGQIILTQSTALPAKFFRLLQE